MEAQSSPHNDKPVEKKPSSDLDALFGDLQKRPSKQPQSSPLVPPPSSAGARALVGSAARRSVPPPPPPSKKAPALSAPPVAAPPAAVAAPAERIEDAELIDDDEDDADSTGKHAASDMDALLPKYDADADDAPTIARSSPLSFPIPSRRPSAPPPNSARLPPPPSLRHSASPSSIARLSAPAAPMKSASELPVPSRSSLPALTPPPSRSTGPIPSRPPVSRPTPAHAISAPLPSAPPTSIPAASVVVADSRPQQQTIPPVTRSDSLAVIPAPQKKSSFGVFAAVAAVGLIAGAAALGIGFKDRLFAGGGAAEGSIVVTVAGPNDAPISTLRVLVDGKEHCTSTPCRVSLASGTHFVRAEAPGFVATADRAVSIEGSGETTLHIGLSPKDSGKAAAPEAAVPVAKLDSEPAKSDTAEPAAGPAPAAAAAPAAAKGGPVAAKPAAAAKNDDAKPAKGADKPEAGGTGTLNINSIPVANVVLDGRPVGSTPIMGLAVSAGPHSVVFVHPEHGRKATGVQVEAGKTATAAVRF